MAKYIVGFGLGVAGGYLFAAFRVAGEYGWAWLFLGLSFGLLVAFIIAEVEARRRKKQGRE